ncbi:MAG: hypothetical protein ACM3PW_11065 [Chlamydiota bacterium]
MPAAGLASTSNLTNVTVVSFSSNSVYDDNLSNSASHHEGGGQQYLAATFGFQQTRRRWQWNLSYRPGVVVGAQSVLSNQFNQVFGTSLEVKPSARWSLKFRQDYILTTDPFDHLGEAALQPGLSPLERPNDLPFFPELKRKASFSEMGVTYRLSRHTSAGVSGSYALQNYNYYSSTEEAWPLINSRVATGNGFISQQISRRYTTGVAYRLRDLTFPGYDMRTLTHSVLSFHQFAVTATTSLVIYAGPEYARTRGQSPALSVSWSPAAGAIYTWSGMHTSVQSGYSRQISDGGGVQGPVRLSGAWLRLSRQLRPRWTVDVSTGLAQQTALITTPEDRLRMLRAGGGFRRDLGRNASLRLLYERLYQTGGSPLYRPGNHNRVMLSIEQSFMRPLGR